MKKNRISALLALVLAMSMLSGCGSKKEEPTIGEMSGTEETEEKTETVISQEFEFYSDDEHLIKFNFPELYELDGQKYELSTDVQYETIGTRDTVQVTKDMNVEELEEIPDEYTYKSKESGKTYELKNEQVYIIRQGKVKVPVIEEIYYEDQMGKPSIKSKKTITYYDKEAGEDKEIEGLLTSYIESTPGHWESSLKINGTFTAPSTATEEYELAGAENITVPVASPTPTWDGYEADVMKNLGLDSKYFRIKSAEWTTGQYAQDGYILRDAAFYGDMFVATYKATYEAEREVENGYETTVYYRVDADEVDAPTEDITTVYHIKAVVTYSLVEDV